MMPGRKYSVGSGSYRYGFNGKEQDKETTGTTTYDYGFRIYNPALGRFLSVDPLTQSYPWYTPYQFAGNNSIWAVDIDGLEEYIVVTTMYSDGGKNIAIEYATKKGTKDAVNIQYRQVMKKDASGNTIELGGYLTDKKVVRIVVDVNGKETTSYDVNLTAQENRIKNSSTRKVVRGTVNQKTWTINIDKKDYDGGIDRDLNIYDEFDAAKTFNPPSIRIHDLNQKKVAETLGGIAYLGGTDVLSGSSYDGKYKNGGIPNGYIDLKHPGIKALSNLLKDIKQDGTIKGVDLSVTFMVGDANNNEMIAINKGLQVIKDQLTQMFKDAGVKNININLSTTSNISQSNSSLQLKR